MADMKEKMAEVLRNAPLSISQTRRAGSNGLRNADEIADKILPLFEEQLTQTQQALDRATEALKVAVRLASDENGEIFEGNIQARESALISWKRQAKAALASIKE